MKNTFTGKTRLFLGISGAIIVIALIMQIVGVGLNLGIDFTGGSLLNYSVGEDFDINDVETILESAGYTGSQLTKAAPSEASISRQAEIAAAEEAAAAEETAAEETAVEETAAEEAAVEEAAVEETAAEETAAEEAAVEETAVEEAAVEEAAAEETAAEETTEPAESILNLDKSSIEADGLTDLQIRLNLVDETEGLEDAITAAVTSVLPNAEKIDYTALTNSTIVNKGFDGDYAGGYMAQFHIGEEFDTDAVLTAVNEALADYSVVLCSAHKYDAEAEAAAEAVVEETAEEATEETAEEVTEEVAEEVAEEAAEEATEEATEEAVVEETGTDLRVMVRIDDQATQVRTLLENEMVAKYPHFTFITIDHVSAVAGRDLLSNAVKALLIAFACMLVYIAIRFDVFSGLAALFGLLHDVLVMCAFMVFFRGVYQVNSSFIAAILTIVGYSINNTIIIFDRIRETAKKPGCSQLPRKEIVEMSVSSTLSRTINTTLTTLITLVALYIFGVESIREFAFPLIVGMLAGTYSSVLLSGQVWASWMEKRMAKKNAK